TISIQTNTSEVGKCSAFIAKTILSTLPKGNVKAIGDGFVQGWKEATCTDISCKAQVIGKSLIKYSSDAGRVIMSLVGVFDLDGAKECAVRWIWVQEIVKELTRQGVYINMIGVHSPAVVWVTNPDGKKAGFLTDGQLVSDIQDSYAVVEGESKFILLPASDQVTTSFEGTGNGVMTIGIINNPSALGKELTYQNVPVLPGTKAQIDNSDSKFSLKLDTNGDGNVDESRLPDKIDAITNSTTSSANATPTKNIPNSICTGLFGVMILPGGALLRLIQKKKNKK
ncbi:MAG: hypothetical protein NTW69_00100, partial [Chloroflexi bacterium]|nr:hypothetical protein [Chloroflexota bacterium]